MVAVNGSLLPWTYGFDEGGRGDFKMFGVKAAAAADVHRAA